MSAQAAINVGVHLDRARSASAFIPTGGGTLTVTAVDGSIFTLSIPSDALASGETITMTPISAIDGLPLSGGVVGAVQLEPDGLQLFELATLVIQLAHPIPIGSEAPIAWRSGGNDLYLYPLARDPRTITFRLMHFSGMGMSSGTSADQTALQKNTPCDAESAATQRVGVILGAERQKALANPDAPADPAVTQAVLDTLEQYFNSTLQPLMQSALQSKNDSQLETAITHARWWLKQVQVYSENAPFAAAAQQTIDDFDTKALQLRSDNAVDRCVKEHKPEYLQTLMAVDRQAQLLGVAGKLNLRTQEKLQQCGKFELRFESTITKTSDMPMFSYSADMHALSIVPLQVSDDSFTLRGSAVLTYTFAVQMNLGSVCSVVDSHGNNDTFKVLKVELDLNPMKEEDPCAGRRRAAPHAIQNDAYAADAPVKIASLQIDVGQPTEEGTLRCAPPSLPPYTIPLTQGLGLDHEFPNAFAEFHHDETPTYTLKDWSPGAGSLIAQKLYHNESTHFQFHWTEGTSLNFFHKP